MCLAVCSISTADTWVEKHIDKCNTRVRSNLIIVLFNDNGGTAECHSILILHLVACKISNILSMHDLTTRSVNYVVVCVSSIISTNF